ncbi:hypothetical protein ACRAWD_24145 [Caulobacter segnis]
MRDGTKFRPALAQDQRSPAQSRRPRPAAGRSPELRRRPGEPYLVFSDSVNRAMPSFQRELGLRGSPVEPVQRGYHAAHRHGPPWATRRTARLLPGPRSTPRPSWSGATIRRSSRTSCASSTTSCRTSSTAPPTRPRPPPTPPCASARWVWA